MNKLLLSFTTALSVLAMGATGAQAEGINVELDDPINVSMHAPINIELDEAAPQKAAAPKETTKEQPGTKLTIEDLKEAAGVAAAGGKQAKEIVDGGFFDDYMKNAKEVEAEVAKEVGPNASLWDKVKARAKRLPRMAGFVIQRAVAPIIGAVLNAGSESEAKK